MIPLSVSTQAEVDPHTEHIRSAHKNILYLTSEIDVVIFHYDRGDLCAQTKTQRGPQVVEVNLLDLQIMSLKETRELLERYMDLEKLMGTCQGTIIFNETVRGSVEIKSAENIMYTRVRHIVDALRFVTLLNWES